MKNLSKIIAYAICLQLTVGAYPLQLASNNAYAFEEHVTSETTDYNNENVSRDPAGENQNVEANEFVSAVMSAGEVLGQTCTGDDGKIVPSRGITLEKSILADATYVRNCKQLNHMFYDKWYPAAQQSIDLAEEQQGNNGHCKSGNCGIPDPMQDEAGQDGASCSIETQKSLAKQSCNFGCSVFGNLGTWTGCPKNSGISSKCLLSLAQNIIEGILEVQFWLPALLYEGGKGLYNWTTGKYDSKTADKAHVSKSFAKNDEVKKLVKDPEKLKQHLTKKSEGFLTAMGKSAINYPGFEEKSKCATCEEKADLTCEMIGSGTKLAILLFGNGLVMGYNAGKVDQLVKGLMAKSRNSKGVKAWFAAKSAKTIRKVQKLPTKFGQGVVTTFVRAGGAVVTGFKSVTGFTIRQWEKFKKGSNFKAISEARLAKNAKKKKVVKDPLPEEVVVKVSRWKKTGQTIGVAFDKLGWLERKMYRVGMKASGNTERYNALVRSENIAMLRANKVKVMNDIRERVVQSEKTGAEYTKDINNATSAQFASVKDKDNLLSVQRLGKEEVKIKVPDAANVEQVNTYKNASGEFAVVTSKNAEHTIYDLNKGVRVGKPISFVEKEVKQLTNASEDLLEGEKAAHLHANGMSDEANNIALADTKQLYVLKDPVDARSAEEWTRVYKNASENFNGVGTKHLKGFEGNVETGFAAVPQAKNLEVEVSGGVKNIPMENPENVSNVRIYQDENMALVSHNDGTHAFYNMQDASRGVQVGKTVPTSKSEYVDDLLGKGTKDSKSFEQLADDQLHATMEVNQKGKYKTVKEADGSEKFVMKTPEGCGDGSIIVKAAKGGK